jgi:hypothetical protein
MATLDSSNILDGNTIEPTDILQLYDALTPGGGTTGEYNVTVSGSLIGNASTATSSSFAITASYALNAAVGGANFINANTYPNQSGDVVNTPNTLSLIVGSSTTSGGLVTINITPLIGTVLGTTAFITATPVLSNTPISIRTFSSGTGTIVFEAGTATTSFMYTIWYRAT